MEKQLHTYRNLLLGMACGDAILYMLFRGESECNDSRLVYTCKAIINAK
jgi:hypothetical protein